MTSVSASLIMIRKFESIFPLYCKQGQPCLTVAHRQAQFTFQTLVKGNPPEHLQPYYCFPTLFSLDDHIEPESSIKPSIFSKNERGISIPDFRQRNPLVLRNNPKITFYVISNLLPGDVCWTRNGFHKEWRPFDREIGSLFAVHSGGLSRK